jgi:hypothetical protein
VVPEIDQCSHGGVYYKPRSLQRKDLVLVRSTGFRVDVVMASTAKPTSIESMDWFKEKSTGKQGFYFQI